MARRGDDLAYYGLGVCYRDGLGVKAPDEGQAKQMFRQAMEMGNVDAAMAFAKLSDGQEQFNAYAFAANLGNTEAIWWMADKYFSESDYRKALPLFESLAEKDDVHSLCVLGDMYYAGLGVEQDRVKARDYYARVWASDTVSDALYHARERYIDLTWYATDKEKAMEEYAALGSHLSDQGLAKMADFYIKQGKNSDRAQDYYQMVKTVIQQMKNPEQAWQDDFGLQMFDIGSFFYSKKMYSDALFFYSKAGNAQYAGPDERLLHYRLAYIYDGHGANDPVKSAAEYRIASDLGDMESTFRLARDYEEGKGVQKSLSKAMELFLKASKVNHAKANLHIGTIYSQKNAYGIDFEKAEKYWTLAAKAGNTQAMKNLIKLANHLNKSDLAKYWENALRQVQ